MDYFFNSADSFASCCSCCIFSISNMIVWAWMTSLVAYLNSLPISTDSNFDFVQYSSLKHKFRFAPLPFYIQVETKHPFTFTSSRISNLQQGDVVVAFDHYYVSCQHHRFLCYRLICILVWSATRNFTLKKTVLIAKL